MDEAKSSKAGAQHFSVTVRTWKQKKRTEIQVQFEQTVREKEYRLHPERQIVSILKAEISFLQAFRDRLMLYKNR